MRRCPGLVMTVSSRDENSVMNSLVVHLFFDDGGGLYTVISGSVLLMRIGY